MKQPVRVIIGSHEYLVKGKENEDKVLEIAEYVNEKLKEVEASTEGLPERKAAILAALNIASDYFMLRQERDELLARIRERSDALILNIDDATG